MNPEDITEFVLRRGKFKNRKLGSLSAEELKHLEKSTAQGEVGDMIRDYARFARRFTDAQNSHTHEPEPGGLQIIPFQKAPAAHAHARAPQENLPDYMSAGELLWDMMLASFKWFRAPAPTNVVGIIKVFVASFALCCVYPPLARGPGRFFGSIIHGLWNRIELVCYEFWSAFESEIRSLLHKVWSATDSVITGSVDDSTFPFGKAAIYAIIGYTIRFAMQVRVIPRGMN